MQNNNNTNDTEEIKEFPVIPDHNIDITEETSLTSLNSNSLNSNNEIFDIKDLTDKEIDMLISEVCPLCATGILDEMLFKIGPSDVKISDIKISRSYDTKNNDKYESELLGYKLKARDINTQPWISNVYQNNYCITANVVIEESYVDFKQTLQNMDKVRIKNFRDHMFNSIQWDQVGISYDHIKRVCDMLISGEITQDELLMSPTISQKIDPTYEKNNLGSFLHSMLAKYFIEICEYKCSEESFIVVDTRKKELQTEVGYFSIKDNHVYNIYVGNLYRNKGVLKSIFSYLMKNLGKEFPEKLCITSKNSSVIKYLRDYGFKRIGATYPMGTNSGDYTAIEQIYMYNYSPDEWISLKDTHLNPNKVIFSHKLEQEFIKYHYPMKDVLSCDLNQTMTNDELLDESLRNFDASNIKEVTYSQLKRAISNKSKPNNLDFKLQFVQKVQFEGMGTLNLVYQTVNVYPNITIDSFNAFVFRVQLKSKEYLYFMLPSDSKGNLIISNDYSEYTRKLRYNYSTIIYKDYIGIKLERQVKDTSAIARDYINQNPVSSKERKTESLILVSKELTVSKLKDTPMIEVQSLMNNIIEILDKNNIHINIINAMNLCKQDGYIYTSHVTQQRMSSNDVAVPLLEIMIENYIPSTTISESTINILDRCIEIIKER